jgi:hypothetical protein
VHDRARRGRLIALIDDPLHSRQAAEFEISHERT